MISKGRFFIETFGCQMNVNDSEKVAGLMRLDGYEPADSVSQADFVFINTCAVREKAAEKLFHALGRLRARRRKGQKVKIGVGGCVAQLQGEALLERAPDVDVLVGTHTVGQVPMLLARAHLLGRRQVDLDRKADAFSVPPSSIAHNRRVRAFVTVMEGCNQVCSFCVVPRTRGPEVNRPPADVVDEVKACVEQGFREVMLLGQTVNAYRHQGLDFPGLLELVNDVSGLQRLRFTTSHPSHVTEGLCRAFRDLEKVCPYLHLPVQSGSDRILESMRRGYSALQYKETVAQLREHAPELALSSDVIVGYPGESERDFQATVDLVGDIGFDGLFVFAYSPRPGTTAGRLDDDVLETEKLRRLKVLNDLQQRIQARRNAKEVGGTASVLTESVDEPGRLSGRTAQFRIVHFEGPASWVGQTVPVEILHAGPNSLVGRSTAAANNSLTTVSTIPIF